MFRRKTVSLSLLRWVLHLSAIVSYEIKKKSWYNFGIYINECLLSTIRLCRTNNSFRPWKHHSQCPNILKSTEYTIENNRTLSTWEKLERHVQTINPFRFALSSIKFKLTQQITCSTIFGSPTMINDMPNSTHHTLNPSIIFKRTKIGFNVQYPLLYLTDSTSNMTAWIPGRNTVVIINKYSIIKARPSDFGFQENNNIIPSQIPFRLHQLAVMSSRECCAESRACQATSILS